MRILTHKNELQEALLQCKSSFLTVAFFSMFVNLLLLVPSFYMLEVYDRVVSSRSVTTLVIGTPQCSKFTISTIHLKKLTEDRSYFSPPSKSDQ
jgi:ABC-type protease/lipase transport system fused ATPase/permease subunit